MRHELRAQRLHRGAPLGIVGLRYHKAP
jgi:hypothetical protein